MQEEEDGGAREGRGKKAEEGRKADTDSLLHVAEEFGVRKEAGSMKGLKRRQRSRCCP